MEGPRLRTERKGGSSLDLVARVRFDGIFWVLAITLVVQFWLGFVSHRSFIY